MGGVADGAALGQSFMLENEGAGSFPVALGAPLVEPGHRPAPRGFEDIRSMRIVTLHTVHAAFGHRMALRQSELGLDIQMALVTGARILAGIDDELPPAAARLDVFAASAMT